MSAEPLATGGEGGEEGEPVDRRAHPEPEALARFLRLESPPEETRDVVRHLLAGCRRCRRITARLWWRQRTRWPRQESGAP